MSLRWHPMGAEAILVELDSLAAVHDLYQAARVARDAGRLGRLPPAELVPAARTVLFDGVTDRAAVLSFLHTHDTQVRVGIDRALDPSADGAGREQPVGTEHVELPTRYDGPDLGLVAQCWDMTRAEVVATHSHTSFVVAFCGFAPGFAYCTGLGGTGLGGTGLGGTGLGGTGSPVPRRSRPRARVPAGSVGLADEFTGVYPQESPGGWQLIGRTAVRLFDVDADPPALLAPGTRVRFTPVAS